MMLMVVAASVGGFLATSGIASLVSADRTGAMRRLQSRTAELTGAMLEYASGASIAAIGGILVLDAL